MPHGIDILVGKRLRLRRTMVGLSQVELGRPVDLTFQQVQKYERGVNRVSASRLYQFARILSVPVSYFFENTDRAKTGSKENSIMEKQDEQIARRETLEMLRAYYRINDPRVRKSIYELIKALADK